MPHPSLRIFEWCDVAPICLRFYLTFKGGGAAGGKGKDGSKKGGLSSIMSTLKMAKKKCVEEDYDDEYDEEDEDDLATDEGKGPARGLCYSPSLNTQFCIKGLLVVLDFCFWAVWAAGPVH